MKHALVFGGSGQIGLPLLQRLSHAGWRVTAISRHEQFDRPGLHWLQGDLAQMPELPPRVDAIFSCGPLLKFAQWYAQSGIEATRVIAFGSTSAETKRGSADAEERRVAGELREGEAALFAAAQPRSDAATVLRPTLIYGAGRDATLTRIAQLAKRLKYFPLPRGANGLRQPVHVDDLADAAFAALTAPASFGNTYAVPGGETLSYRDMVERTLACLRPPVKLVELPSPLFNLALVAAQAAGRATGLGEAAVRRMRTDMTFDAAPARRDFGYAPRSFQPSAEMFETPRD
ncbi:MULTISPECIES: nucleoside-diphosphate sugar epimerase [Lysobacter]|jgi:nucleoside-diphosphate-sugar epimerase|uniref:Nucleoside-diphosphate sugar epimerase n=1 Tax=Lysobacter gummosus TaxID=262324 RepID=A0ABY3X9L1_9GAMM|nr:MULTISPECIES: nucleoside-diphosphate sugar epimerase [Lysobacter]ALN93170.1 NAD dependent epimerase/dehydratase family protein [Lysobacter gummosus]UJB20078.1 nucleoside-diphosphate sugar epimerase [Lysobacter capsici]UJQ30807.1 nucleoside-diphosphate sugar epimerase [Lysobacter gummosus]UNP28675.1 nucleoside-diphosphate sugar epimerase [Lysobacter gummosus]